MLCPKCNKNKLRYIQRREDFTKTGRGKDKKTFKRTDFTAECKCGWKGEVY